MISRAQLVCLHLSVALLTITGVVYAWMKYLLRPADEFSAINHPLQPHVLSAHILVAPLAIFAFGWLFATHIWPAFTYRHPNRASGIAAMTLIAPMVLSGYLLQIASEDATRHAMAIAHWIASGVFVIAYVAHLLPRQR
jgi:hypothetical protein